MAHGQLPRIVVTSPGDVRAERNVLPMVIEELNNDVARMAGCGSSWGDTRSRAWIWTRRGEDMV